MGRAKNSVRNALYGIVSQCVSLVLGLINRTVFLAALGVGYLGLNGLLQNLVTVLSLADMGFATAMAYALYRPLAEGDHACVVSTLAFFRKLFLGIAITIFIVGMCLLPLLGCLVNLSETIDGIEIYYVLYLANSAVSYLFVYKTCLINAMQRNDIVSRYTMIVNIIRAAIQIASLYFLGSYTAYLACMIAGTLAVNLLVAHRVNMLYPQARLVGFGRLPEQMKHSLKRNIGSVAIYKAAQVVATGTDNIVISVMVGTVWVGYYSNYLLVTSAVLGFVGVLFSSATASVGNLVVTETASRQKEIFDALQLMAFIIAGIGSVSFFLLIGDFVSLWLGDEYVLDSWLTAVITGNFYLGMVLQPIWMYRDASGFYQKSKWMIGLSAILNILLSVLLAVFLDVAGVLLASIVSRLVTYFWYEPIVLYSDFFQTSSRDYFLRFFANAGLTIAACAIGYFAIPAIEAPSGALFALKALAVIVAAGVFFIAIYISAGSSKETKEAVYSYIRILRSKLKKGAHHG